MKPISSLLKTMSIVAVIFTLFQCKSEPKKEVEKAVQSIAGAFDFVPNPVEVPKQDVKTLQIGDKAPDFRLPGTDKKYHSLSDYDSASVLVIIFTSNHCPTAQAYEERIKAIVEDYSDKNVQVIGISPNSPIGLLYEELGYSDLGDSYEDMIIRDEAHHFNFPYLYDGDDQKVALSYGPVATPHCFVFDEERVLQYVGRIDASEKPGTANGEDLRNAIDAVLAHTALSQPITKTFGCSTKWGWNIKTRAKIDAEWAQKEVSLVETSIEGIKDIMKNKDSNKLRLVNIWATWCAPCRIEYPELIIVQRMFGARDFEFVSISADKMSKKDRALDFLKEQHSAIANYIVTSDDNYELIEAVDPQWNGALPYTALIAPGGDIVWEHQGEVDFLELKRVIVDHEMIGRVY